METEKLVKIIEELKEVRTETKSKVSDEALFDCSVRIYNSEQIESNRQKKDVPDKKAVIERLGGQGTDFSKSQADRIQKTPFDSPATHNQIWLLKNKLNYKGEIPKSSREASKLIDKLKGKSK